MDRRALAAAALAGLATFAAPPALAQSVKVDVVSRVPEGQQPRVRLLIKEKVERLGIELTRDDGRKVTDSFTGLSPGMTREVSLPGDAGKFRWSGHVDVTQHGATRQDSLSFDTMVAAPLRVEIDKSRVNLAARTLEVRMTRPAGRVEVKVFGATGDAPIVDAEQDFRGRAAGETLTVSWPAPVGGGEAARIDLRVYDADGFYTGMSLVPWSVHIPHEEVNFATDSATITADQTPKLIKSLDLINAALARHRELGPIKLFIAGHTDTVGKNDYNLKLSQRRAQSIASWFRTRGLRVPVYYEGFGEQALLVATPDQTDEARNRRVDYILAVEEPTLKTTAFRAAWKRIR